MAHTRILCPECKGEQYMMYWDEKTNETETCKCNTCGGAGMLVKIEMVRYKKLDEWDAGLTFGEALNALNDGFKIARKGWNGKDMFLFLLPSATIPKTAIHDPMLKKVLKDTSSDHFEALGSIRMKTADDKILTGWLASQTDMLAEDWFIYS